MSDRVHTDEIDDVLSSVRKLVSHAEKHPPGLRPHVAEQRADRFVLTSALRVPELTPDTDTTADGPTNQPDNGHVVDTVIRADRADLEAAIAELEAAMIGRPEDWDSDDGESLGEKTWAASVFQLHALADDAEATPSAAAAETTKAGPKPVPDAAPKAEMDLSALIDHDALRDMVAAVLREELNGALGERITRNVRKLVRREINRVLVSREFD